MHQLIFVGSMWDILDINMCLMPKCLWCYHKMFVTPFMILNIRIICLWAAPERTPLHFVCNKIGQLLSLKEFKQPLFYTEYMDSISSDNTVLWFVHIQFEKWNFNTVSGLNLRTMTNYLFSSPQFAGRDFGLFLEIFRR